MPHASMFFRLLALQSPSDVSSSPEFVVFWNIPQSPLEYFSVAFEEKNNQMILFSQKGRRIVACGG
jgi:hypothetical protein